MMKKLLKSIQVLATCTIFSLIFIVATPTPLWSAGVGGGRGSGYSGHSEGRGPTHELGRGPLTDRPADSFLPEERPAPAQAARAAAETAHRLDELQSTASQLRPNSMVIEHAADKSYLIQRFELPRPYQVWTMEVLVNIVTDTIKTEARERDHSTYGTSQEITFYNMGPHEIRALLETVDVRLDKVGLSSRGLLGFIGHSPGIADTLNRSYDFSKAIIEQEPINLQEPIELYRQPLGEEEKKISFRVEIPARVEAQPGLMLRIIIFLKENADFIGVRQIANTLSLLLSREENLELDAHTAAKNIKMELMRLHPNIISYVEIHGHELIDQHGKQKQIHYDG